MFILEKINPEDEKPTKSTLLEGIIDAIDGAFLSGLSDIVKAGSKLYQATKVPDKGKPLSRIEITAKGIESVEANSSQTFLFADISNLVLHNNSEQFIKGSNYEKFSRISFTHTNETHDFFYKSKPFLIKKICKYCYENEIPFKEYANERRVFLGKVPSYKEIQALKEKYNMEWT